MMSMRGIYYGVLFSVLLWGIIALAWMLLS